MQRTQLEEKRATLARATFVEHCGGARWFIVQPGGTVPAHTDLSLWSLFNSVEKLIISFADQGSDLIHG